ncbi:hypothetical protein [Tateyamaria sp. SN6-1]|uniref:bestrophin-like domain n=1 Tax=Tateyamaria sp. SN6-1 TaxID=3092148 RepID=UPI0039F5F4DE
MYDIPTLWIALGLLLGMFGAMFAGRVIGRRHPARDETETGQVTATQASILGILGLLLGFTFSVALGRHDARSAAVVSEANAIGTAWLRTDLLNDPDTAKDLMRAYATERLRASTIPASLSEERDASLAQAEQTFAALWSEAARIVREAPNPATTAFANALNDVIDELAARDAAIDRHVPEVVLIMLYLTFLLSGGLLGYGSGVSRTRITATALVMPVLIVSLVFVIIDLDRPRRGLIIVDQGPLIATVAAMEQRVVQ